MEKSIAIFAVINFSIIGLSHIIQHETWREFFSKLHALGRAGAFANGFLTLIMGSLIVAFHNVWMGMPVLLTLIGWGYLVKSLAIFVAPNWNLRSIGSVEKAPVIKFRVAGIALLAIAATLTVSLLQGDYDVSR